VTRPLNQPRHLGDALAYFITFHTYGTWLHATAKGSVDREHNQYGAPRIPPNPGFEQRRRDSMRQDEMILTPEQRDVVEKTIREVCQYRGWQLRAINVRTNHVHVVVSGAATPEKMLGDFKRYATRRLREHGLTAPDRMVWSEHGSTRYLWEEENVFEACDYVTNRQ
jgi:REP element-mobilizing transposase RayT